jgi:hypothetical protein
MRGLATTHAAGRPLLCDLLNKLARILTGHWMDVPPPLSQRPLVAVHSVYAIDPALTSIVRRHPGVSLLAPCTTANDTARREN